MICFTWWGLTQYAARAIQAFNKVSEEPVSVVATRPKSSPVKGMEQILTCPLVWVNEDDSGFISRLPEVPRVLFVSNWNLPCWQYLERVVKMNGGKTVAMIDTNYKSFGIGNGRLNAFLRQVAWIMRFGLFICHRFDHFFVVGASGQKLMRSCGVSKDRVSIGLYGADSSLFCDGAPLTDRPKRIIYVGQFINRKNVRRMIEAFIRAQNVAGKEARDWCLDMFGAGSLSDSLEQTIRQSNSQSIRLHPFCQPENLAAEYRNSRVFCLPSLEEHWGVVVHEAALSGCGLLLANGIGAGDDFLGKGNGIVFDPFSVDAMVEAMVQIMRWSDARWESAHEESIRLSAKFGLDRFVKSVAEICSGI